MHYRHLKKLQLHHQGECEQILSVLLLVSFLHFKGKLLLSVMMFPILPAHPGQRRVLRRLGRRQLRVALVLPFLSSTNLCFRPVSRQECQTVPKNLVSSCQPAEVWCIVFIDICRNVPEQQCRKVPQTSCVTHSGQQCNTVFVDSCRLYCCIWQLCKFPPLLYLNVRSGAERMGNLRL